MKKVKNTNLLIILIIYVFIIINLTTVNKSSYFNIVNSIFWGLMLIYLTLNMKNNYIRINLKAKYFRFIAIITALHVLVYICLGFVFGFSKSPYSHELTKLLENIIISIVPIIGIEVTRGVLTYRNRNNRIIVIFVAVLIFLSEIDYSIFYLSRKEIYEYLCGTILPLISYSFLYTYLVLKGSYFLPIIFKAFSRMMFLFLPVFTNLSWFVQGSFGIISSVVIFLLFKYQIVKEEKLRRKESNFLRASYIIALTLSVLLVCFISGVFAYEPITILSNSMKPEFSKADVIIYEKLSEEELKNINIRRNYSLFSRRKKHCS